jgi:hypothetical protein
VLLQLWKSREFGHRTPKSQGTNCVVQNLRGFRQAPRKWGFWTSATPGSGPESTSTVTPCRARLRHYNRLAYEATFPQIELSHQRRLFVHVDLRPDYRKRVDGPHCVALRCWSWVAPTLRS